MPARSSRILPPPPSSAGVPMTSKMPLISSMTDAHADGGGQSRRADQVVAAAVPDAGQGVVLGQHRDDRTVFAAVLSRRERRSRFHQAVSRLRSPRSRMFDGQQLRSHDLLVAELRVLANRLGDLDDLVSIGIDRVDDALAQFSRSAIWSLPPGSIQPSLSSGTIAPAAGRRHIGAARR